MRLSDGLKSKRAELLDRVEAMSKAAEAEGRVFSDTEAKAWDVAMAEIKDMDAKIERQTQVEDLLAGRSGGAVQPVDGSGRPQLIAADGTILRALGRDDRLADLVPAPQRLREVPSMGAVIRAMATGNWSRVQLPGEQQRAMGVILDQPFPVPQPLSNVWLDLLRAQSTVFEAGAMVIPMTSMTHTIVALQNDPTFKWRVEHVPLPSSDLLVSPLTLKARTCGALVPMSIELSEDSPFADDLVQAALLRAAAAEIDRVMLAGSGNQVAPDDEPRGLLSWPGIGSVPATVPPTGFADQLAAYGTVLANNDVPNAMIGNTALAMALAGLTDTTGQPLNAPQPVADLDKYWTNKLPADTSITGNYRWLAWGLRTGLTLEITRQGGTYTGNGDTGSTFNKLGLLVRLHWRGDVAVLRPKSFCKSAPATP